MLEDYHTTSYNDKMDVLFYATHAGYEVVTFWAPAEASWKLARRLKKCCHCCCWLLLLIVVIVLLLIVIVFVILAKEMLSKRYESVDTALEIRWLAEVNSMIEWSNFEFDGLLIEWSNFEKAQMLSSSYLKVDGLRRASDAGWNQQTCRD